MPKRTDLHTILLIGSGPIVIGQACEFDYSGTQACKALKSEGYRVILVNSNPATIMTDPDFADRTYIEPLSVEVLEKIMQKLYARRIQDTKCITTKKIREILKELHLRKYYENSTLILCLLTNREPPRLSPAQEEQLKLRFLAIQKPFEDHCPPERKNFLSYSYCLYKFCEMDGLTQFLDCFSLLKGRDKLFKQDEIYKKISESLGWPFHPSV